MALSCPPELEVCVVRGDIWEMSVGLSEFPEVEENPSAYEGHMVFRQRQDDNLTPFLELTAPIEQPPTPPPGQVLQADLVMTFNATTQQTAALAAYEHVHYVELRLTGGGDERRLFEGGVRVQD